MKKELFALLTALVVIFGLTVLEIATPIDNSDGTITQTRNDGSALYNADGTITQTRNDGSTLYNADGPMAWWADHYQATYSTGQQKKSGIHRGKQIQNHDDWIPMKRQKQLVYGDRHSSHGYEVWRDTGFDPRLWSDFQMDRGM